MTQSNDTSSTQTRSTAHYDKPDASYARSLRAIGQALEILRINVFRLEKAHDKYIISDWEASFLKNVAREVWDTDHSGQGRFTTKQFSDFLFYDSSDTARLDVAGRAKRGSKKIQESHRISSGLRAVGDYLDKHRAVAFNLWWSPESVTIRYKTVSGTPKEANFTVQNLQDFGVGMYLRRSRRKLAKW